MLSNFISKDQNSYEPVSIVRCYYAKDDKRTVFVKMFDGKVVCIPKTTIQTEFSRDKTVIQELIIDDWILRKLGLII